MEEKKAFLQRVWHSVVYNPSYKRGVNFVNSKISDFNRFFGISTTDAGEDISVATALSIDTLFSCINCISQDVAKLKFSVKRKTSKGRTVVSNMINFIISTRPNSYTSSINFWYNIIFNMLAYGNGYALITKKRQSIERLEVLHPDKVECLVIENEIFYKYETTLIKQEDMLHFKLYSFDGIVGVSPIMWNANTFGYRVKMNKYQAKVLGSKPEGLLSFSEGLNPVQQKEAMTMWKDMTQGDNLGKTPVLGGGAKYTAFTLNPDVVQMLETANLNDERITGIYRVPPTIIQKYKDSAFKSPEQQDTVYLKYTLTPIMKVIRQECDYKLFPESNKTAESPLYTQHNIKEMLRGSLKEQREWYKFLRFGGLANADTILEMEDMPPLENNQGQIVVIQGANIPLEDLKAFYQGKTSSDQDTAIRKAGFDIESLKTNLDKLETMNQNE